jgi:predicted DNA-binding protein (UPF0251 family)
MNQTNTQTAAQAASSGGVSVATFLNTLGRAISQVAASVCV